VEVAVLLVQHKGSEGLFNLWRLKNSHFSATGHSKELAIGAEAESSHGTVEVEVSQHHALLKVYYQSVAVHVNRYQQ